jgi:predicted aminopeptidase
VWTRKPGAAGFEQRYRRIVCARQGRRMTAGAGAAGRRSRSGAQRCIFPRIMRIGRRIGKLRLVAALALACAACSPVYVLRAGIEEAKILSRRRPIDEVIRDAGTDAETRRKLDLVLQARTFAEQALEMDAGQSYTTYSYVDSDTLLLVVSAARPDRFEPYTWWFPIVGRVPYKGFFDFGAARRQAAELDRQGYDTYVRPASAFSTLGFFNDPLLNTLLRFGDVDLVSTVIHELLHNTIFLPGQVSFNESFANFVGERGAIAFFCAREGADADRCRQAEDGWHDMRLFGRFLNELVAELEALYAQGLPLDDVLAARQLIFDDYRARFTAEIEPALRGPGYRWFVRRPLNNATLIGVRLYYRELDLFERILEAHGGDLRVTIQAVTATVRAAPREPFDAVRRLAGAPPGTWSHLSVLADPDMREPTRAGS